MAKSLQLDVIAYKYDRQKDLAPTNAAIAKANSIMHEMEIGILSQMVRSNDLDTDRMLIVDGPLQFLKEDTGKKDFADLFYNVVGVSKSFDPMLFSNVDDPNWTIESILNYIETSSEFKDVESWDDFKDKLRQYVNKTGKTDNKEIQVQSWRRFSRLINNSVNDRIFQNSLSGSKERHQTHISDAINNIEGGQVYVVDIAGLNEQLQGR